MVQSPSGHVYFASCDTVWDEAAGRKDWDLDSYLSVLAPISNPWVGCEGMPVSDGGGDEERGMCDGSRSHVHLIITLVSVYSKCVLPLIYNTYTVYVKGAQGSEKNIQGRFFW